ARGPGADRERTGDARTRLERVRGDGSLQVQHAARLMLGTAIPQHDDELVAGKTGAEIVLPDCRAQDLADRVQRAIAGLVPVRVIDLLEPVEVEEDDADGALRARGAREGSV